MNFRARPQMFVAKPRVQLAHYTDLTMPRRNWAEFDRPPLERGFVSQRPPRVLALSVPTILRQAG